MSSSSICCWPTRICFELSSTRSSPRNGRGRHRASRAESPAPSDVPARHGDAARELRDCRGGHAPYRSAAGRGNAHLRPRQVDKPTTRKAGDFSLLLIHPTRGDCSPRPHVSKIWRLTHAATPAPPAHQSRGPDGTAPLTLWSRPHGGRGPRPQPTRRDHDDPTNWTSPPPRTARPCTTARA